MNRLRINGAMVPLREFFIIKLCVPDFRIKTFAVGFVYIIKILLLIFFFIRYYDKTSFKFFYSLSNALLM